MINRRRLHSILKESIKSVLNEEWTSDGVWHLSDEFKNATYEGPNLEDEGFLPAGTHPSAYPHPVQSDIDGFNGGYFDENDNFIPKRIDFNMGKMIEDNANDAEGNVNHEYRRYIRCVLNNFIENHPEVAQMATYEGIADEDMPEFIFRYMKQTPLSRLTKDERDMLKSQGKEYKTSKEIGITDPYTRWNEIQSALEYRRMYPEYMDVNV